MEAKGIPVKIYVIPVFRRFWCFHAVEDVAAATRIASDAENIAWTKGANLEERVSLLGTKISSIVSSLDMSCHGRTASSWCITITSEGTVLLGAWQDPEELETTGDCKGWKYQEQNLQVPADLKDAMELAINWRPAPRLFTCCPAFLRDVWLIFMRAGSLRRFSAGRTLKKRF